MGPHSWSTINSCIARQTHSFDEGNLIVRDRKQSRAGHLAQYRDAEILIAHVPGWFFKKRLQLFNSLLSLTVSSPTAIRPNERQLNVARFRHQIARHFG